MCNAIKRAKSAVVSHLKVVTNDVLDSTHHVSLFVWELFGIVIWWNRGSIYRLDLIFICLSRPVTHLDALALLVLKGFKLVLGRKTIVVHCLVSCSVKVGVQLLIVVLAIHDSLPLLLVLLSKREFGLKVQNVLLVLIVDGLNTFFLKHLLNLGLLLKLSFSSSMLL